MSTIYKRITNMGRQGYTARMIGLELDLSQEEMQARAKEDPDFARALRKAADLSLGFHEGELVKNAGVKSYNTQAVGALLRANHPDKYEAASYRTASEKTSTASDSIDYEAEISKLIADLKKADSEES